MKATKDMGGFKYLNGKKWADVTRDERYFCQHLYTLLVQQGAAKFLQHHKLVNKQLDFNVQMNAFWEPAFEICFYRDMWQLNGRNSLPHSLKRTFDLCLFSEEAIIVIEAKAQQSFDRGQLELFKRDREEIQRLTKVKHVYLLGLASSRYVNKFRHDENLYKKEFCAFDGEILTWKNLSVLYGGDAVLNRADDIFEEKPSWGMNNDGYMTGEELLGAYDRGDHFWVGRSGGINGKLLEDDISSGAWRFKRYETSAQDSIPNMNWFPLEDFIKRLGVE